MSEPLRLAIDRIAKRAAFDLQRRQPRADYTIGQLPVLPGGLQPTDVLPVFRPVPYTGVVTNPQGQQTFAFPAAKLPPFSGPLPAGAVASQTGWVSLADYGVPAGYVPGSGQDDTASWNAWVAALPAEGALGYIPPAPSGRYNFAGGIRLTGKTFCRIIGGGMAQSTDVYGDTGGVVLYFTNPTANCLQVDSGIYSCSGFNVDRAPGATAGYSVLTDGTVGSTYRDIGTPNAVNAWGFGFEQNSVAGGGNWLFECKGSLQSPTGRLYTINSQQDYRVINCSGAPNSYSWPGTSVVYVNPAASVDTFHIRGGDYFGFGHALYAYPNPNVNQIDIFFYDNLFDGVVAEIFYINAGNPGSVVGFEEGNNYTGCDPAQHRTHGVFFFGYVTARMYGGSGILNAGMCGIEVQFQNPNSSVVCIDKDVYANGRVQQNTYDGFHFTGPSYNTVLQNCQTTGVYYNRFGVSLDQGSTHTNIRIDGGHYRGNMGGWGTSPLTTIVNSHIEAFGINDTLGQLVSLPAPGSSATGSNPFPLKATSYISGGVGVTIYRRGTPIGSTANGATVALTLHPGESYSFGPYTAAPNVATFAA